MQTSNISKGELYSRMNPEAFKYLKKAEGLLSEFLYDSRKNNVTTNVLNLNRKGRS
jgi:hypothetical protein